MNKKILTIHSEDRDINKWPNPNEFEVYLPDSYTNIQQMNLINFSCINNFYNISEKLMNNYIKIIDNNNIHSNEHIFIIPDGFYSPEQLALTLTKLFNHKSLELFVLYDKIKYKFVFITKKDLQIDFETMVSTDKLCIANKFLVNREKIADQYSHWGIGYNLGFTKQIVEFIDNYQLDSDLHNNGAQYFNDFDICLNDTNNILPISFNINEYKYAYSDTTIDLNPLNTIYMEIDKHNYADEIKPYQYRSNYLYCNDYNATVNSYFAKIILNNLSNNSNELVNSKKNDGEIYNGTLLYNNTIDRLIKLKFKFRYHNNVMVEFNDKNFNFTLEFIQEENKKKLC